MWAVCAQPPVCGHVVPGLRFLLRCGGWELRWRRMPLRSLGLVQTSAPWERRRPSSSWRFEGHAVAELVARALIGALGQPGPERCGCTVLWANMGFRARPADQCPPGSMTKDLHNPTIVALQRFAKRGRPLHVKARTAPPILLRTKSTWKRNGWKAKVPDVEWTYTLVTFSKPCIAPILNLDHLFWKGFGFALCKYRSVLSQKALMGNLVVLSSLIVLLLATVAVATRKVPLMQWCQGGIRTVSAVRTVSRYSHCICLL